MHFDHGTVQTHRFDPDTHDLSMLQLFKNPIQYTALGPAIHPGIDRVPIAEPLGQTAPLAAMLGHVQDRIENEQVRMADVAALFRQTVLDLLVLRFVEFHLRSMPYK
jgi:hypothetical protein